MDNDYFDLGGKTALVTGASSGLGWHFANVLASAGCKVIIAARRVEKLKALGTEISSKGGQVAVLPFDIQDNNALQQSLETCFEENGVPDILINNAGIAVASRFLDADVADTDAVWKTNQSGLWHTSQTVCKRLIAAGKPGSIINIASILGLDVMPGVASYAVSKAAVLQITKVMALELARHNIKVNAIAPGYFSTEMNQAFLDSDAGANLLKRVPMRRAGNPDELNGLLLLLASSRSAYMTGSIIPVDGGHLVSGLA